MKKQSKLTLSKSQYVKGRKCPLSLWFARAAANDNKAGVVKPEARKKEDSAPSWRAMGDMVGTLAQSFFKGGVEIKARYWETQKAAQETKDLLTSGKTVIFEATAIHPGDGSHCRIDILRKVPGTEQWDMIEVKSASRVKDEYLEDITFQRHVFEGAGYKIRNCYIMHINRDYERKGQVDPAQLFKIRNVNADVKNRRKTVAPNLAALTKIIESPEPPPAATKDKCTPNNCKDRNKCWGGLPLYSIFNVYAAEKVHEIAAKIGSFKIEDIPEALKPDYPPKRIELEAHLKNKPHVDKQALNKFLDHIEYPVYYLDYETVSAAIPLYDRSAPYQQIPFQFSLHVQQKPDGKVTHDSFLHKSRSDPRRAFAEELIKKCGHKGSVIVYSKDFESSRNNELALAFPDLAPKLKAINERMVDLYQPFQQRILYDPAQNGSLSLKTVLPVYTGLRYDGMEINNGEQAMQEYQAFARGDITDPQKLKSLWDGLEEYCKLDTYAMVALLKKLYQKAGRHPGKALSPRPDNKP